MHGPCRIYKLENFLTCADNALLTQFGARYSANALRGQIFKSVPASEMEKLFRTHS